MMNRKILMIVRIDNHLGS